MIRVLLVDDETPARQRLRRLLGSYPEVEIVSEAENGTQALEEIERCKPDVVFLDIEMPELNGFEVAHAIDKTGPAIVFVTAYDEHALKAFNAAAIDYLVKPVVERRLEETLKKIKKLQVRPDLSRLLSRSSKIAIRCASRFVVLDFSKISAITAQDHYAAVRVEGREFLADDPLDVLEKRLTENFIRIHRSGIINLDYLSELQHEGDRKYVAVLSDILKTRVPVSRERLPELKRKLGIGD